MARKTRRGRGRPPGKRLGRVAVRVGAVAAFYVVATAVAHWQGYRFGGNTPVRCRAGHVFTTIWIPGVSVKSVRLGWFRFQRCPVGAHWTLVQPVREDDLTDPERVTAAHHHDTRLP